MTVRLQWWQWAGLAAVLIAACLAMWIRFARRVGAVQHLHVVGAPHSPGTDRGTMRSADVPMLASRR